VSGRVVGTGGGAPRETHRRPSLGSVRLSPPAARDAAREGEGSQGRSAGRKPAATCRRPRGGWQSGVWTFWPQAVQV